MSLSRQKIFEALDKERAYQDSRFGTEFDKMNGIGHWIVYLEEYLKRAKRKFMGARFRGGCEIEYPEGMAPKSKEEAQLRHNVHKKAILNEVKKVAALCIACLEHLGEEEPESDNPKVSSFPEVKKL